MGVAKYFSPDWERNFKVFHRDEKFIIIKKFAPRSFNNIHTEYGMSGTESSGVVCKVTHLVLVFIELITLKYIVFGKIDFSAHKTCHYMLKPRAVLCSISVIKFDNPGYFKQHASNWKLQIATGNKEILLLTLGYCQECDSGPVVQVWGHYISECIINIFKWKKMMNQK